LTKNLFIMDNGFLIQITNKSNVFKQAFLFSHELPEGVDIQTLNGSYDFNELNKIAINQPFVGNSITSNYSDIIQLEIINDGVCKHLELLGSYEGEMIKVDGNENSIKINCPPHSVFTIRLFFLRF